MNAFHTISIRSKILIGLLGFFIVLSVTFTVYSILTTRNYKQLRINEVTKIVSYESERVSKVITEMERNAIDLALSGRQFFLYGNGTEEHGISIAVDNFTDFPAAVGGGIWYEPYVFDSQEKYFCFYAFFDDESGAVRHDPTFATEEYDYHNQMWYRTIKNGSVSNRPIPIWTAPYYDDSGTNALMTTVGAGIFIDNDKFIGMSTVDWQIESMVERLTAIKPTEHSFVILVCPKVDIIISNTHRFGVSMIALSVSNLAWFHTLSFQNDDGISLNSFDFSDIEYLSFSKQFTNGWIFSIQIPADEIFAEIDKRNKQFIAIFACSFIFLILLAYYFVSKFINNPLKYLTDEVIKLGNSNLDKQIIIKSKDEIGTLAAAFNKMTIDLKTAIVAMTKEKTEKERIGAELNIARQIQMSMLPCIFPPFPDRKEFDIFAIMQPAKEVGGDFYDYFMIDKNTLALVMADVSGKGVPAALFMVITKTLIKNNAQLGKNPKEVLETVNNLLNENNEAFMFVTCILGYLDLTTGVFTYVNAGHNPLLLYSKGENKIKSFNYLSCHNGFVLAVQENMLYKTNEITLQKGDVIFLYTDGVTEAFNTKEELFGEKRLLQKANNLTALPLHDFIHALKKEVDIFTLGTEQSDDITMLVLQYVGNARNL